LIKSVKMRPVVCVINPFISGTVNVHGVYGRKFLGEMPAEMSLKARWITGGMTP
jgi:hypothetical protein